MQQTQIKRHHSHYPETNDSPESPPVHTEIPDDEFLDQIDNELETHTQKPITPETLRLLGIKACHHSIKLQRLIEDIESPLSPVS